MNETLGITGVIAENIPAAIYDAERLRSIEKLWLNLLHKHILGNGTIINPENNYVIQLSETSGVQGEYYYGKNIKSVMGQVNKIYSIKARVSIAQYHDIVIPRVQGLGAPELYRTAIEEIKYRIKRKLKSIFTRKGL
jgi:hypothetical protein